IAMVRSRSLARDGVPTSRCIGSIATKLLDRSQRHNVVSRKSAIWCLSSEDHSGEQSLAYVYGRETRAEADITNVLTMDEARRIASNIATLTSLLQRCIEKVAIKSI